jgi:uncharacterized membrane protein YecN with MAPEG domain
MKIAILCTAFLALLQLGLALGISGMRRRYRLSVGTPEDANHPLSRTRTAFSNCAEWHPTLIVLMLILQMSGAPGWSVWLSPLVVISRYLMVAGLVTYPNTRPNSLRVMGAGGTYVLTLVLCVLVLVTYWPAPGPFLATPAK